MKIILPAVAILAVAGIAVQTSAQPSGYASSVINYNSGSGFAAGYTNASSALGEVNGVIRELRNVIQGLETNVIQPTEFRTALKSLALMLGDEKSSRVRLDLDQAAVDSLTPPQATELVHIAREAVSNSVRHGKAVTTAFGLHIVSDKLHFSVEDDGCGFNVETAETKGYGLRNMAKRAEGLGAKFTIHSQEGTGTRIVLDIPKQKQHFSNSEFRARTDR